jgi:ComF family protein
VHIEAATSSLFFTTSSAVQHLIHQIKYRGQQDLAVYLGRMMGLELASSQRFPKLDLIVPLPLFRTREKQRGYNQSSLLAQGISAVTGIPQCEDLVARTKASATQTKHTRAERWMNVEGMFRVSPKASFQGGNILLVDDVITTGATLEACSHALLSHGDTKLYIATLAFAMK